MIYANGREWLLDPGRLTYSHKEYKTWVKTSAAHNTITLDGRNQAAHTGELLWFTPSAAGAACAAQSRQAYPGALLTRYLALEDRLLVDVVEVQTSSKSQIDLLAHALADQLVPPDAAPAGTPVQPGGADGYPHLTDATVRRFSGDSRWAFAAGSLRLTVWLIHEPGEQLIAAHGIGYHVGQKTPTLIRRRNDRSTRFICVYDLSGDGSFVRGVRAGAKRDAIRVEVDTVSGPRRFGFTPAGLSAP